MNNISKKRKRKKTIIVVVCSSYNKVAVNKFHLITINNILKVFT